MTGKRESRAGLAAPPPHQEEEEADGDSGGAAAAAAASATMPTATARWKLRVVHDGLPVVFVVITATLLLCGLVPDGSYSGGSGDGENDDGDDSDSDNPTMIYSGLMDMCDHIDPQMSQAWLNPFTSVVLACFVPPLYLLIQLIRKFDLIGACTSRAHTAIDRITRCALGKVDDTDAQLDDKKGNPIVDDAIEEGKAQAVEMINTRADETREKVDETADQANQAIEEAEAAVASFDSQHVEVFFLLVNSGISLWALLGYLGKELRPQGGGICMAAYITAVVQYKPFALSMFAVVSWMVGWHDRLFQIVRRFIPPPKCSRRPPLTQLHRPS